MLAYDIGAERERWPAFAPFAIEPGIAAAHAVPLPLRGKILGTHEPVPRRERRPRARRPQRRSSPGRRAAIAILQSRAVRDARLIAEQLQQALDSRIAIEQAKGMLAERGAIDLGSAFVLMRSHSRSQQRRLSQVAHDIVTGVLDLSSVLQADRPPRLNSSADVLSEKR